MNKRRTRPSQLLYVPPACRNIKKIGENETSSNSSCPKELSDKFKSDIMNDFDHSNAENNLLTTKNSLSQQQVDKLYEDIKTISLSRNSECEEKVEKSNSELIMSNDNNVDFIRRDKELSLNLEDNCSCSKNDYDVDREKEQMERAIVKINRKSRSFIDYNENDNVLLINKKQNSEIPMLTQPNQNSKGNKSKEQFISWENTLQNSEDEDKNEKRSDSNCSNSSSKSPLNYIDKKMEDLDHVVEVYDFPESFKTQDIIQLYSDFQANPVYVKWCDDTHALLVFSTPAQARVALKYDKGIIKSRPLTEASPLSKRVANKIDLKPAMRRPATSMQTARRLINNYLGTKVAISKEDMEKEKKALKDAREKKRIQRQNEKDAWEGHPKTNI
ncbi:coiled-coil domain-containing protein R3HCC1L [Agrilus planipennis]|uniref:Coiled-coil domain-containing protein R3HCC1L n=1 Tax=Agrilus planipennis TaxID=224129 RepID=A0A1W4X2R8_AGRPL|nr:coiled-coil domain-containing protein R3HCC1L [Agrilus planipennis]XP_018327088.1 coiled-coil domain-containing protein R3HCC1L [Agrilus planipennis]XP_018327089.1 coiled-coil domain-containing protein R3HCC1L [Agrilus planipennis]XP_018327090.1 coiled-coil domain-containing protein R3HCC1L [Agrilus planipennis]XP_018327091.1 coiled-coil domain-containing protein R3HCC1L [Agrilus planipennis]